jgi:hypothetical protein
LMKEYEIKKSAKKLISKECMNTGKKWVQFATQQRWPGQI